MTATVETVSEQLDLTTIIPTEKIDTTLPGAALTRKDNGLFNLFKIILFYSHGEKRLIGYIYLQKI